MSEFSAVSATRNRMVFANREIVDGYGPPPVPGTPELVATSIYISMKMFTGTRTSPITSAR